MGIGDTAAQASYPEGHAAVPVPEGDQVVYFSRSVFSVHLIGTYS